VTPGAEGASAGASCELMPATGAVAAGGRVLAVTAIGPSFEAARDRAYAAVSKISFPGRQYRRDIGAKALEAIHS